MVSGAFPIQTKTSCADHWIRNEKTGILVDPLLPDIKRAVRIAISDDELIDQAMLLNRQIAAEKLKTIYVSDRLSGIYSIDKVN
jgi:hypothetical protein